MSETVQLALIAAIPPTIASLVGLWISWLNRRETKRLITKTDEIHVLANDNLSKQTDALAVANQKIQDLKQDVGQLVSVLRPAPSIVTDGSRAE